MSKLITGELIADVTTADNKTYPVLVTNGWRDYMPLDDGDYYVYDIIPTRREIRVGDTVVILDNGVMERVTVSKKTVGKDEMITSLEVKA